MKSEWIFKDYWKMDHRDVITRRRLKEIDRIIVIVSGKGGVGKSMIATTMSFLMAKEGRSIGLFDVDLYSSSSSSILGANNLPREATHGLIPPTSNNVKVMSISLFIGGRPASIGGKAAREIIKEMLTITEWGKLDCLIVDTPAGIGDTMMMLAEIMRGKANFIVVTTPSKLSVSTTRRIVEFLLSAGMSVMGIIENMSTGKTNKDIELISRELGVELMGRIPLDIEAAEAIDRGDLSMLIQTNFATSLLNLLRESKLV